MTKAAFDTALTLCAFRADGAALSGGTHSAPTRLVVAPLGSHDARGRGKVSYYISLLRIEKAMALSEMAEVHLDGV